MAGILHKAEKLKKEQVYSRLDGLPSGTAPQTVTPGCLVLEGGAWRGLYTAGVLDALMEAGINFQTVIGVSAGAMSSLNYMSGQIGLSARINLSYRHDSNYCGSGAMKTDHGITGFTYFFDHILQENPLNLDRLYDPARRLVVVATNCETGKAEYFDRDECDIYKAVQASATVPYISRPVIIDGTPYLDGGCAAKIPYRWAVRRQFPKIMVVRTRDRKFRKTMEENHRLRNRVLYAHKYPNLERALDTTTQRYNRLVDEISRDEESGRIFVQAPSWPVTITAFEGDVETLGSLYWRGYYEMQEDLGRLREYLEKP